jgi:hypothetical protein
MKQIILLIAFAAFLTTSSKAQNEQSDTRLIDNQPINTRAQFHAGVKIGFNYSNIYDSQGEGFITDPKVGLAAGAFLAIPIGKYLGFQPELLYSQKGFKASGTVLGVNYDFTRTTTFIDIPLLIQFKPNSIITVLVGPQYSYLIRQRDDFSNATLEQQFQNDNIRKNVMCFLGGIDICPRNLVIGARVGWDVQNNNGDGTATIPRYKNIWYQVTMGLRF